MRRSTTLARWTLGVVLITWRYMWSTTPLHRTTAAGDLTDVGPPLPDELTDSRCQPMGTGVGPVFHRLFTVDIDGSRLSGSELLATLAADLNRAVPTEVVGVERIAGGARGLALGDEVVVHMPGPWDGPVRVVDATSTSFRLATLSGHMEAGQIEFRTVAHGSLLRLEIEVWARPASRTVQMLYARLRVGKEIQLNMWVRFCLSAVRLAGGRARGGVTIRTRVVDEDLLPGARATISERSRA
ncbi:DUF1990 family protein [Pseudonocardia parietis]|uniref:DUF1990 domain-containing protein n=1 Tax=Pseudonocardia parietis TaxID=570936 RepID=A0ABS4VUJ5_9PSEU|nr:DUF1990 family protein [Pseudonocardia parietis]MBP2367608.1 hypothetical protein [Pseudonocardia parietis]